MFKTARIYLEPIPDTFYPVSTNNQMPTTFIHDVLLAHANIHDTSVVCEILKGVVSGPKQETFQKMPLSITAFKTLYKVLAPVSTDELAAIWAIEISNFIYCNPDADVSSWFTTQFTSVCNTASTFIDDYAGSINDSQKLKNFCICLQSEFDALSDNDNICISPIIGFCGNEVKCLNAISSQSAKAIVLLSLQELLKTKSIIRKCSKCGLYFLPASRSDEIYCNNCKKLSYDTLKREDPVIAKYRTIYKTQYARKVRNEQNIPKIDEKFKAWSAAATQLRDRCKNGEITLAEMVSQISGDEWMYRKEAHAQKE